jgi:nucleotide sugar dehydrogenase
MSYSHTPLPDRHEKLAVIGIGSLGLCFALNADLAGYTVLGYDINQTTVGKINDRTLTSSEPGVVELLKSSRTFRATTQVDELIAFDAPIWFIVIDTPSLPTGEYDHSKINRFVELLTVYGAGTTPRCLVVSSTVMPGYTDRLAEQVAPLNLTVCYNPEFIAQGTILRDQQLPDQVLIGEPDPATGQLVENVYRAICRNEPTFCRMSRLSAEICKIATNCFLTTKISFANSIGDLALSVGAEPDKILAAIGSDSRIGGKYLKYGFGFGGPCFPRDNRALALFARSVGQNLHIAEATDRVNTEHLEFQVQQYLNDYEAHEIIDFEGVTYKKGSELLEESQQLALAARLAQAGRQVRIHDTPAVLAQVQQLYPSLFLYPDPS